METQNLSKGDEIIITGPTTGVIQTAASEIRFDLHEVDEALKGQYISIPIAAKVRRSDKLFKVVDAAEVKHRR